MAETFSSFWGPMTSTTECCEKNYVYSSYIAEFYNTISNIPTIILAFIGLINASCFKYGTCCWKHVVSCHCKVCGSHVHRMCEQSCDKCMTAHAELIFQQSDETPMVWEMLLYVYILHSPDWHYRRTMPIFLFLYGAAFAAMHSVFNMTIGFKVHYIILCLLCTPRMYKYYIYTEDVFAKRLAKLYVATLVLGSLFWLDNRLFCKEISRWPVNPQGHAFWHVFTGFKSYFANTFLTFCHAQQHGWSPKVVHLMGVLPYVKIEKQKSQ